MNNNNNNNNPLHHYSRETHANNSTVTQISSKCHDDGYGFLWNLDLEENSLELEDGVASNLDAIRFEVDNNNNNMVLL